MTKEIIVIASFSLYILGLMSLNILLHKKASIGILKLVIMDLILILLSTGIKVLYATFVIIGLISIVLLIVFLIKRTLRIKNKSKAKIDKTDENSFFLDSSNGVIQIGNPYRGIIVQGGAGSGKSQSIFYPLIKQLMEKGFSGVLYDFKSPELSEFAHAMHSEFSTNVQFKFLDFKDYTKSDRINPLSPKYVTKQAIAFELASVLISNLLPENIKRPDYWSRSSISIIAGAIWYLRNNHSDKSTLPHLIAMILYFPSSLLIEIISKDIECVGMISSIKEAHEMKAEKQLAGVVGTIKNAFAQLNFPELFYLLSKDDVNLDLNNTENPTFLCLGNDSTLANTFAPIISLVISTCLRKMNEPNKLKSAVLLDELPTLYIPNLEQIPATARSNKIATILGLQDYSQMVDKYGQDKAQVLMSNLGNQFYGRTVNERTAKMISAIFGKEDRKFVTKSTGSGAQVGLLFDNLSSKNKGSSESMQERERVKVSDITNLSAGEFYGVIAEGNQTELLGVQLSQTDVKYKPFETKNKQDLKDVYKMIYQEIKEIIEAPKNNSKTDEIHINLK